MGAPGAASRRVPKQGQHRVLILAEVLVCGDDKKYPVVGISVKIKLRGEKYRLPLTVTCSDSFRPIKCSQSIFEIRASN